MIFKKIDIDSSIRMASVIIDVVNINLFAIQGCTTDSFSIKMVSAAIGQAINVQQFLFPHTSNMLHI